ncbi:MAG: hypothetical protein LCH95_06470 [Proteobacteria bacterium]|nr:hypothetical protein [Pseudomonadota bacterium]
MSRRLVSAAGLVAALALGLPAGLAAQTQSTRPGAHAGTQIAFPASVGGATLERSVNYGAPPNNRPDQGIRYYYSTPKKMVIGVHLYDGGRRVPSGSGNPVVIDEFMGALSSAELQVRHGGYTGFERPPAPSSCTFGNATFRCITYSAVNQGNARLFTKLMMTGYRDHFLAIQIDWSQARGQSASDADAALKSFVSALLQ